MISFFPSPYPDELWYSVICRYHVHSGNYCAKHTLRQLYEEMEVLGYERPTSPL